MAATRRKLRHKHGGSADRASLSDEASARRWDAFTLNPLSEQHPLKYLSDAWSYRLPLYWQILERTPPGGSILEVGAGSGAHAFWLAAREFAVTGVDYRPPVVDAARTLAQRFQIPCSFDVADAFDLTAYRGFDLVFSVGVIEHWPREKAIEALREQTQCGRVIVAEIPTRHTHLTAEVTDERFYSLRELRAIFRAAGMHEIRTLAYGHIPNGAGRARALLIPPGALKLVQRRTGRLAMSLVAIGRPRTHSATGTAHR